MSPVGLIGIILCLAALPLIWSGGSRDRLIIFFGLFATHVAMSFFYYQYVQTAPADTNLYYYFADRLASGDFAFGTIFVGKMVHTLRELIGGTYLDYFLLFQAFGFWGIILLMRTFDEIHEEIGVPQGPWNVWLLFLPGVHFWTSAIGKDAPLFLAVSLAVWSVMRLWSRLPYFGLALVLMVAFRPHIAAITVAMVAVTEMLERRSGPIVKLGLGAIAAGGFIWIAGTLESAIGVDASSGAVVEGMVERRNRMAEATLGGTTVGDTIYPLRVLGLLFRPLFIDAKGVLAIIASFENLVYVFVVGFILVHWRSALRIAKNVYFLRFALLFSVCLTLLLSLVFYNVGLALRQKMMIVPGLFTFFVAHYTLHRSWSRAARRLKAERERVGTRQEQSAAERRDFA